MPRSALSGSKIKSTKGSENSAKGKGRKRIKVYLDQQIVEAYEGAERIFRFECVTGDKNGPTEPGRFRIYPKKEKYTSNKYKVPMDYAMFFTPDRRAFHKYHGPMPFSLMRSTKRYVTDLVGSKGCVRLREADAIALFEWTPEHTEVHIS